VIKSIFVYLFFLLFSFSSWAGTVVVFVTNFGQFEVELFDEKAPATVKNFLNYVDSKFYNGTIFHRVINDFMIQGGGFTKKLVQKKTKAPIKNEASPELKNDRGTIAMARTSEPHSATSQFFINVNDNTSLNYSGPSDESLGYAVFGKVIKGMHVVDRIKAVKTGTIAPHSDVPMNEIIIKSVMRKS